MKLTTRTARIGVAALATSWVSVCALSPVYAAEGTTDSGVAVVNTETVQVYLDSSGKVTSKRVYDQLSLTGHGKVDLRNPVETKGLRNLDGFSGVDVKGGAQVVNTTVDGTKRLRTVSTYTGDLPVTVDLTYKLDGKTVKPGDVVGKSGKLEVIFDVENVTGTEQEVTFPDGSGGTVTKTTSVPLPIAGSVTTTVPASFTNVRSTDANMGGDGRGGTKLSFTMTLFPPIGSTKATFGYTADITNGVVPNIGMSIVPVNPLESPTFKSAAASYQGGADTGAELAAGAAEIDANLLKLRDGAADLLAGLIQLRNGANQLSSGLDSAVSGSGQLADGAGAAYDGSKQLASGTKQLDSGLGQAKAGSKKLKSGAAELAAGQKSLGKGLEQLRAGVSGMPKTVQTQLASNPDYNALLNALSALIAGVGDTSTPDTLVGGLQAIATGLEGATDGLDKISTKLSGVLNGPASTDGTLARLKATINAISQASDCGPVCQATVTGTANGIEAAQRTSLGDLKDGVDEIYDGITTKVTDPATGGIAKLKFALSNGNPATCDRAKSTATPLDDCGVKQALQIIKAGIPTLVDGITASVSNTLLGSIGTGAAGCDPTKTLLCASGALTNGASQVAGGAGDLSGGVDELAAGGAKLSAGAGELTGGLAQLRNGAGQLASGLKAADDGSGQLAAGLGEAAGGAPQLVDGSERLSAEGTKKLVKAGETTTQSYGEMVAVISAGAKRAQTESMVKGAPTDALAVMAYDYVITGETGEGSRNLARTIGAVVLAGVGAGILALRRRRLA